MKTIEAIDSRGRKVLRVKQSQAELHEELARLQAKHLKFLSMRKAVQQEPEQTNKESL